MRRAPGPDPQWVYVANRTMGTMQENGQTVLVKGGDDIAVSGCDGLREARHHLLRELELRPTIGAHLLLDRHRLRATSHAKSTVRMQQ